MKDFLQIDIFILDFEIIHHFIIYIKIGVLIFDVKVSHEVAWKLVRLVRKSTTFVVMLEIYRENTIFLIFLQKIVPKNAAHQTSVLYDVNS